MRVKWTHAALGDLGRLHAFLAPVNPRTTRVVFERLKVAPRTLQSQPRLGTPLSEFAPREVRRLIVGDYELRHEITEDAIVILRLWHTCEHR